MRLLEITRENLTFRQHTGMGLDSMLGSIFLMPNVVKVVKVIKEILAGWQEFSTFAGRNK